MASSVASARTWPPTELHPVPHARGAFGEFAVDRLDGRLLGQGDDPGGGEHGHVAGGERERGVAFGDDQLDGGGQTGTQRHRPTIQNPPTAPLIKDEC